MKSNFIRTVNIAIAKERSLHVAVPIEAEKGMMLKLA
jgi:hypothetical protein